MRFENVKLKIHLLTIGSTAIKNRLWIQITHKDRYIDTYSITIQIFVIIIWVQNRYMYSVHSLIILIKENQICNPLKYFQIECGLKIDLTKWVSLVETHAKYIFFYGFVSHKLLRLIMLSISSLTMADIKSHQNCEFSLVEPRQWAIRTQQ